MQNIPKIIHYVWFGASKDLKTEMCIESWKKHMPEFEIKEWNEINAPQGFDYLDNAIALKNWSNVSNFLRLWAVKNFGGIYMDTDFEIIKSFDFLENINAFIGFESEEVYVNNAVFGSVQNHDFTLDCFTKLINDYDGAELSNLSGPVLATDILKAYGMEGNHKQAIRDILIFTRDYFHPYDPDKFFMYSCVTRNTYGIHHWAKSWIKDEFERKYNKVSSNYYDLLKGRSPLKLYIKMILSKLDTIFFKRN